MSIIVETTIADPAAVADNSVPDELSTLAGLADEANQYHHLAECAMRESLHHARVSGETLIQAKQWLKTLRGHGHWMQWLEENFEGSQSTANEYMYIAEEFPTLLDHYHDDIGNLTFAEALRWLRQFNRECEAGDEPARAAGQPEPQAVEQPAPVAPPTKPPEQDDEPEPVRSSSKPPAPIKTARDKLAAGRPPLTERMARADGTPNIELGQTVVECYLELQKRIKAESVEIIVDGRDGCVRFNDGNARYSSQVRIRTWEKQPAAKPVKIQVDAKKLASILNGVESWDEYDFFVDANGVGTGQTDATEEWFIPAQAES
jgi:hypothetical protein